MDKICTIFKKIYEMVFIFIFDVNENKQTASTAANCD